LVDGSLESPCRVLVKCNWTSFLTLTVEALQGKRCPDSLLSGGGRSVRAKISGGRGRLWRIFFSFYKTRHVLLSDSENCTVLRAVVLTHYRRVTDRDGIAVACSLRALRRAVKTCSILLHMTLQYGELRPTSGCDRSSLGTRANFNKFRVLAVLLQRRRSP